MGNVPFRFRWVGDKHDRAMTSLLRLAIPPAAAVALSIAVLLPAAPAPAQDAPQGAHATPPTEAPAADPWGTGFRPLPLHQIARRVDARYEGRLLAAQMRPPRPPERDAGVQLVYELRLLTPQRNILNIRLDARTGRFLEVAGRGQLQARRPGTSDPAASDPGASGPAGSDPAGSALRP